MKANTNKEKKKLNRTVNWAGLGSQNPNKKTTGWRLEGLRGLRGTGDLGFRDWGLGIRIGFGRV